MLFTELIDEFPEGHAALKLGSEEESVGSRRHEPDSTDSRRYSRDRRLDEDRCGGRDVDPYEPSYCMRSRMLDTTGTPVSTAGRAQLLMQ